jgi:hypothetical protein
MFQDNLFPNDQLQFLNLDLIDDDNLLLTVPQLAAPDETGTVQFTPERLQLRHEPFLDPQDDTSTIL